MILIDEDELREIRARHERWARVRERVAWPPDAPGTGHDRMRLLEMLDLVRGKLRKALERGDSNALSAAG